MTLSKEKDKLLLSFLNRWTAFTQHHSRKYDEVSVNLGFTVVP